MGQAFRLGGISIVNPSAETSLTEPFGVSGLAMRYEADSFTGAVGTATSAWTNKVDGSATTSNAAGPLVGPSVTTPTGSFKTVDFYTNNAGFMGVENLTASASTVAAVFTWNGFGAMLLQARGRKLTFGSTMWTMDNYFSTAGSPNLQLPLSTYPRPTPNAELAVAVLGLSIDGTADTLTIVTGGAKGQISGTVKKDANQERVLIGAGSHTAGYGPGIAAVGVWNRQLSLTEINNTLLPAMRRRFGVNVPA